MNNKIMVLHADIVLASLNVEYMDKKIIVIIMKNVKIRLVIEFLIHIG